MQLIDKREVCSDGRYVGKWQKYNMGQVPVGSPSLVTVLYDEKNKEIGRIEDPRLLPDALYVAWGNQRMQFQGALPPEQQEQVAGYLLERQEVDLTLRQLLNDFARELMECQPHTMR